MELQQLLQLEAILYALRRQDKGKLVKKALHREIRQGSRENKNFPF